MYTDIVLLVVQMAIHTTFQMPTGTELRRWYSIFEDKQGPYHIIEGDILLTHKNNGGIDSLSNPGKADTWVTRSVPYSIDAKIRNNPSAYTNVQAAIDTISSATNNCLRMQPKQPADKDYIYITSQDRGCFSAVGRRGGQQIINIGDGCESIGIILHELMHALGFWHEQSRSDRDKFVSIYYQNIIPGKEMEFQKRTDNLEMEADIPYDFHSILHYKYNQFAKVSSLDTIVPNPKFPYIHKTELGQREQLSHLDITKINWLYKCDSTVFCVRPDFYGGQLYPNDEHYRVGDYIQFMCNPGFIRIGARGSVCKADGRWAGAVPYCIKENGNTFSYCDMEPTCVNTQQGPPSPTSWNLSPGTYHGQQTDTRFQLHHGNTPSMNTGPIADHTYENSSGSYLYLEASRVPPGTQVQATSPSLRRNGNVCILFYFNMFGEEIGSLAVYLVHNFHTAEYKQLVWGAHGSTKTNDWQMAFIQNKRLYSYSYKVMFEATRGGKDTSDIAIDDVFIGSCNQVRQYRDAIQQESRKKDEWDWLPPYQGDKKGSLAAAGR